jgi:hypothetical protein
MKFVFVWGVFVGVLGKRHPAQQHEQRWAINGRFTSSDDTGRYAAAEVA